MVGQDPGTEPVPEEHGSNDRVTIEQPHLKILEWLRLFLTKIETLATHIGGFWQREM